MVDVLFFVAGGVIVAVTFFDVFVTTISPGGRAGAAGMVRLG